VMMVRAESLRTENLITPEVSVIAQNAESKKKTDE
jgi:hypothetical protein